MDAKKANKILTALETTEANVAKLERVWNRIEEMIPQGVVFGNNADYDDLRRQFGDLVASLPAIGGFRLEDSTLGLNEIAQWRFDAQEYGELDALVSSDEAIGKPERDIADYKFRLRKKRRELVLVLVKELVDEFDSVLSHLIAARPINFSQNDAAPQEPIDRLKGIVAQLERLMGSLTPRPQRWSDLRRHLEFGQWIDVMDILNSDWPAGRPGVLASLYAENDPLPMSVADLDSLETLPADTHVPTALAFNALTADTFERLVFALVGNEAGYENAQWLMRTNAPDRGRDISVVRIIVDSLGGTRRERVIIQCKHWRDSSVGIAEFVTLKEQVKLWEPPRVEVLVIASTGRFSADAVLAIERHNAAGELPRIEMWPDSHLELLLSRRPILVAEFGLRSDPPTA